MKRFLKIQLNSGPDLIRLPVDTSGFIKDFTESFLHSLFGLGQLKVDILTCRLCPQVKMLFMSHFNSAFIEPLCPLRYATVSVASIPSFHFWSGSGRGGGKGHQGGERTMRSGVCIPLLSQKGPNISRHASWNPAGPLWLRPEWD